MVGDDSWPGRYRSRQGADLRHRRSCLGGIQNRWGYGDAALPGTAGFSDSYFEVDKVLAGFIYGGGLEFTATQHWLVRIEAMHVDFGTPSSSFTGQPDWGPFGTYTTNFKNSATIGRAGLSWKW